MGRITIAAIIMHNMTIHDEHDQDVLYDYFEEAEKIW
jgi:hypothetical protein